MKSIWPCLLTVFMALAPNRVAHSAPPESSPAHDGDVQSLLERGRYQEAISIARQAIAREKTSTSPSLVASHLYGLGTALSSCGWNSEARPLLERAIEIERRARPLDSLAWASSLTEFARILVRVGDSPAATSHLDLALSLLGQKGGGESRAYAEALSVRGSLYLAQARYREAQPVLEHALTIRRRLGLDSDVGRSLTQLASFFGEQHDIARERPLLEESIAILERTLGPDHPALVQPLTLLSWNRIQEREIAQAQVFVDRQLRIAGDACGPDSPLAVPALLQRAKLHLANHEISAARADADRALRIEEGSVGVASPRLATWFRIQGDILKDAGDTAGAEAVLRRSLALATIPGNEVIAAASMSSLGSLLWAEGRREEAREMFERSLAICDAQSGPDNIALLNLQYLVGSSLSRGEAGEKIAPLLERAIPLGERVLGLDDLGAAQMRLLLVPILGGQGEIWRAETEARKAFLIYEKKLGPASAGLAQPLVTLSQAEAAKGDVDAARSHIDRAVALLRAKFGDTHPVTAGARLVLAQMLESQGDLGGAAALYESAASTFQAYLGLDHPAVAQAVAGSASVALSAGRVEEAARLYDRAISSLERAPGTKTTGLAPLLATRAEIYQSQGQLAQAEAMFVRARDILVQDSSQVLLQAEIDASRASVLGEMGRTAEARSLFERVVHLLESRTGTESPVLAEILQKQGTFLLEQAAYIDAGSCFERAYVIFQKRWGADHYLVGHSLIGRGAVEEARGDYAAARTSYDAALKLWQKTLGPGHPNVAAALYHLGRLALSRGDFAAAEGTLQKALEIQRSVAGSRNPALIQALLALGNVRYTRGDYPAAQVFIKDALGMSQEIFGSADPRLAGPLNSLGLLLRERGQLGESVATLERARQLLADAGQADSPNYAKVISNLGGCLAEMGRYRDARPLLERALSIWSERLGHEHPDVAGGLGSLASLLAAEGDHEGSRRAYESALTILAKTQESSPEDAARMKGALALLLSQRGEYAEARRIAQESLKTLSTLLGPGHPDVGNALRSLGDMLSRQGDTPAAIEAYRSALAVTENALGAGHPQVGLILRGLGSALMCKGDLVAARINLERAKNILEASLSAEHPVVGEILFDLGQLRTSQGDLESGEALTSRAAEIITASLGPDHPGLISILSSLAINRFLRQQKADSASLLKRATEIESAKGSNVGAPSTGWACHLASAQAATSHLDLAMATFDRALNDLQQVGRASGEEALGLLMGRGSVSLETGDFKTSWTSFVSADRIAENALGADDPRLGLIVGNLGLLDWRAGRRVSARRKFLRSSDIFRHGADALLPSLSFAEQRAFLGTLIGYPVPYLLSFFGKGADLSSAYPRVFPLKGLLVESLRREAVLTRMAARDPHWAARVDRLRTLRTEVRGLQRVSPADQSEARQRVRKLGGEKEQLERELLRLVGGNILADPVKDAGLRSLRHLLAADEAIVDIYRYQDVSSDKPVDQYGAVVLSKHRDPIFVHLGGQAEVHSALEFWRNLVLHSSSDAGTIAAAWQALEKRLWSPIVSAFSPAVRRVWLSPDDELSRFPWQLFPTAGGSSDRLVTQIDSVREFVRLKRDSYAGGRGRPAALIVGGIDFGAEVGGSESPYAPLPASGEEAAEIRDLGLREGLSTHLLAGTDARKVEILRQFSAADYVHLATHGFFSRSTPALNSADLIAVFGGLREPWMELLGQTRNPLAESGIALAGANDRPAKSGESAGILTAEELIGVDLARVRLLTLSACETGRGEEDTGQGVLGLRMAFLAAGARTIVMSLWKVPDEATQELMRRFYVNLWQRKLPPLASLLAAQRDLREDPSGKFTAPLNWAGWILVGEGW